MHSAEECESGRDRRQVSYLAVNLPWKRMDEHAIQENRQAEQERGHAQPGVKNMKIHGIKSNLAGVKIARQTEEGE